MIWLWLIPAVLLAALGKELLQILLARAPRQQSEISIGRPGDASSGVAIPRIIWSYWHQRPSPEFIARCQDNWRRQAPDHELRFMYRDNVGDWLDARMLIDTFDQLPPFRQADWLRVQLLARHGGIWIDASTLLTENLDWLHDLQQRHGAEYAGFYIDLHSNRPELPIIENWFMAAVPASLFAQDLAREFDRVMRIGEAAYLQELAAQGRLSRVAQKLDDVAQNYLIMHMVMSDLLDRQVGLYRLALLRAEDSAFALHRALGWRKRHLYARLALTPCPKRLPALIKLRGGDRRVIERGWSRHWLYRRSALAKYLGPASRSPAEDGP